MQQQRQQGSSLCDSRQVHPLYDDQWQTWMVACWLPLHPTHVPATLHPHPTLPVTSATSRATDSLCWCWRLVCLLPAGDCHGWPRLHVQPRPGLVSGAWCGQRQSIFGHGELHVAWFCPTQLTAWQPGTSRTGFACHTHATYTPCLCCPLAPCTPDSTAPGWFNPAQTCIPSASLLSPPPASPPVLPHPAATWRSWR
jgi:hypothetical protein